MFSYHGRFLLAPCAAGCGGAVLLLLAAGCKQIAPANVAATVNNRPITYAELEKTYKSQLRAQSGRRQRRPDDVQKLEVLRSLIDNEIMLQRAEKLGLMAEDADVEAEDHRAEGALHQGGVRKAARADSKMTRGRSEDADPPRSQHPEADQQGDHVAHHHHRRRRRPTSTTPTRPASTSPSRRSTWRRSW